MVLDLPESCFNNIKPFSFLFGSSKKGPKLGFHKLEFGLLFLLYGIVNYCFGALFFCLFLLIWLKLKHFHFLDVLTQIEPDLLMSQKYFMK